MVAYFAALPTELINVIAHRLVVNRERDAVLFVDKRNFEGRKLRFAAEGLRQSSIFQDVVIDDIMAKYPQNMTIDNALDIIIGYYQRLFEKIECDFDAFEEIICVNDGVDGEQNLYFNHKNIKYTWLQSAANYCPGPAENLRGKYYAFAMNKYKALSPFAEYAQPCLCENSHVTIKQLTEKGKPYTLWDPKKCIADIADEDWQKLFSAFGLSADDFDRDKISKAVMVVRNSYGALNMFTGKAAPVLFRSVY